MYNCTSACFYIQAALQVSGGCLGAIVQQPVTMYRPLYRRVEAVTVQLYSSCNYIQAAVQVRGGFKCTIVKQPVTMYRMLYRRGEGVTV